MGQRFQSVFILPEKYLNEGNPNNRSEQIRVYHNQWLFGYGALEVNLRIIKRINKAIKDIRKKENKKKYYDNSIKGIKNFYLEKIIENAIKWASVQELNNETNFLESGRLTYNEEEKKPIKDRNNIKKLLNNQDNNNGFFICIIGEDLKIKYTFLNGFEDADKISQRTPKEYLNLFYSDERIKEMNLKEETNKLLNKFNKFKEIEKERITPICEYLNRIETQSLKTENKKECDEL